MEVVAGIECHRFPQCLDTLAGEDLCHDPVDHFYLTEVVDSEIVPEGSHVRLLFDRHSIAAVRFGNEQVETTFFTNVYLRLMQGLNNKTSTENGHQ